MSRRRVSSTASTSSVAAQPSRCGRGGSSRRERSVFPLALPGLCGSATRRSCRASSTCTSTKALVCCCATASRRLATSARTRRSCGRRTPRRATRGSSQQDQLITVPGGYPTGRDPAIADPITSPAEGAAEVDKLLGKGAALIKIALEDGGNNTLPMLSVTEVQAIVAEAHKLHRIVTAHVLRARIGYRARRRRRRACAHAVPRRDTRPAGHAAAAPHSRRRNAAHRSVSRRAGQQLPRWPCERKDLRDRWRRTSVRHRYSGGSSGARPDGLV